ncbi:MAG: CrcB family protein [Trueperaceae bacterium]|nr:CrcB family protein [Trueperaceae bacterium]
MPDAVPASRPATLTVALGAAVGTGARALVGLALPMGDGGWPWPTLAVNLLGSFALGAVFGRADRGRGPTWSRGPGVTTGVLGSFTTFSALAVETGRLVPSIALGYAAASLAGGLLAAALGWRTGRGRP